MRCPYPCSYALETSGHRCSPVPSAPGPPCTLSCFFPISCTLHGREWGAHGSLCRVGPLLYLALLRSTGSKGQLQGRCRVRSGKGGQWLVLLECSAPWMTAHRRHICPHLLQSSHHKVAGWFSHGHLPPSCRQHPHPVPGGRSAYRRHSVSASPSATRMDL